MLRLNATGTIVAAVCMLGTAAAAQAPCVVTRPTADLKVPHVAGAPRLNTDPGSDTWAKAAVAWIVHDCAKAVDYPRLKTEIRVFWTTTDLYLLFICPFDTLNLFLPTQRDRPRHALWDRDVIEIFLGDNWQDINKYREFEIAPTGDWIDLDIDLNRDLHDENWRSGWVIGARIDHERHIWYAAARIPLRSISSRTISPGTQWRMNLYRTDGLGADPERHFMCWQPTCAGSTRDPNHVPENFGTLTFGE
jgi:hypothetical protein